jgi:hypothetical protein
MWAAPPELAGSGRAAAEVVVVVVAAAAAAVGVAAWELRCWMT